MLEYNVEKGWGKEIIFVNNKDYCGKLLIFDKAGSKGSMHFHMIKHETWYVQKGSFIVRFIDTQNANTLAMTLNEGAVWSNKQGQPHQLEALEDNSIIFEVSTAHYDTDSYRVFPGDGQ
jgi:quercetin dioxygenase-like cupin family protein